MGQLQPPAKPQRIVVGVGPHRYAAAAAEHGWSRATLLHQIKNRTHQRLGAAPSTFADRLPAADSDLARELAKDPYPFDFLGLTGEVTER